MVNSKLLLLLLSFPSARTAVFWLVDVADVLLSPKQPSFDRDLPRLHSIHCLLICTACVPGRHPNSVLKCCYLPVTGLAIMAALTTICKYKDPPLSAMQAPVDTSTQTFSACPQTPFALRIRPPVR
jgi:hypothetical protein